MSIIRNGDQTGFDVADLAPTALVSSPPINDNSTQIATTGWVKGQGYAGPVKLPSFADAEIPAGTMNSVNVTFTLANAPNPAASLQVFYNSGIQTGQYSLSANTITLNFAPSQGDSLVAYYRY